MDLEGIVLGKVSLRERQMPDDFGYMCNLENKIDKRNRGRLKESVGSILMVLRWERAWGDG